MSCWFREVRGSYREDISAVNLHRVYTCTSGRTKIFSTNPLGSLRGAERSKNSQDNFYISESVPLISEEHYSSDRVVLASPGDTTIPVNPAHPGSHGTGRNFFIISQEGLGGRHKDVRAGLSDVLAIQGGGNGMGTDLVSCNGSSSTSVFVCRLGECIPISLRCNGVPDCTGGEDESVRECGCLPNEFQCGETCIDSVQRCDTLPHCPDGLDEQHCETYTCPTSHFKCNNHFCVPSENVCDFHDHCGDASDEHHCHHRQCWKAEFECSNGQCVRPGRVCDGHHHCKDGSDEVACTTEDFAVCGSGSRVHRFFWCDGWPDCPDNHADELHCGECEEGRQHKCANTRCILASNLCDSFCDCVPDCDDETHCTTALYTRLDGVSRCEVGAALTCMVANLDRSKDRCISHSHLCDGRSDCHNGRYLNDESGCAVRGSEREEGSVCAEVRPLNQSQEERPVNHSEWFFCQDGRCLPSSLLCDFKYDCLHGDDEFQCEHPECSTSEWRCLSGQCIPRSGRCDLKYQCFDKTDEIACGEERCDPGTLRCDTGQCISPDLWCDWIPDCPDASDERYCGRSSVCSSGEFRCSSGQCIPAHLRCDAAVDKRNGCADLSHLLNCSGYECGRDQLRCGSGPCLDNHRVCDGHVDCPLTWDDEDNCPFVCSASAPSCECRDITISCEDRGLTSLPQDIELQISRFRMSGNYINHTLTTTTFRKYSYIVFLDLSNNSVRSLPAGVFVSLGRLRILDLRDNQLSALHNSTFLGLASLRTLHLTGNRLVTIDGWSLYGLSSLSALDLSRQGLINLTTRSFVGLRTLLNLNLSHNQLVDLPDGTFSGLSNLLSLDLRGNPVDAMAARLFTGLTNLHHLWTDEFRFCCLARHVRQCLPEPDEFSSCEDLMSNNVLRVCVWVLGSLALAGNLLVIIWRLLYHTDNKVHSFLITNLALGDLCMGLYLLIIAAVDVHYRGVYFIYDAFWRTSTLCQLAGFFSTFSSELSVFTLTVITLERLVVIMFPFRVPRLNMRWTKVIMTVVWVCVCVLAALPLADIHYFRNFYGRSGVCLALHITHQKPSGWEYSVFVFLVLNLASFSVIAGSYWGMYQAARSSSAAVRSDQQERESSMATKMTIIVVTDAACWLPIILLGLVSLAGVPIPAQVFAWVAVFVLPLNAAVNPLLYTLSTAPFLGKARERAVNVRHSFKRSVLRRTASPTTAASLTGEAAVVVKSGDVTATIFMSVTNHDNHQPGYLPASNTTNILNFTHENPCQHKMESNMTMCGVNSVEEGSSLLPLGGEIIPLSDLTSPGPEVLVLHSSRRKPPRQRPDLYD